MVGYDEPCWCGAHHFWSHDGLDYHCSRCNPMPRVATHTRVIPNPPEENRVPLNKRDWNAALDEACKQLSIGPGQLDKMVHEDEKASAAMNVKQLVAFARSYLTHS